MRLTIMRPSLDHNRFMLVVEKIIALGTREVAT